MNNLLLFFSGILTSIIGTFIYTKTEKILPVARNLIIDYPFHSFVVVALAIILILAVVLTVKVMGIDT